MRKGPGCSEVSPSGSPAGFGFHSRTPSRAANLLVCSTWAAGASLALLAGFLGSSHRTGFLNPSRLSLSIALSAVSGRGLFPRRRSYRFFGPGGHHVEIGHVGFRQFLPSGRSTAMEVTLNCRCDGGFEFISGLGKLVLYLSSWHGWPDVLDNGIN